MSLLSLQNIQIAFGGPPLLAGVSLDVNKGERICILGRNGAGKSTLLRIMSGSLPPDAGAVILDPGLRVAHLEQNVPETLSGTAFEVVAAGAGPAGLTLAAYHREIAAPADPERLHKLQHELNHLEGWKIEPLVKRALGQVQVDPAAPFASLSGGMRRRVFLARALVQNPDVLLLDEPTNHLDLESIAWLETFLVASRLTVVFVTHDRRLLRKLATRIVEIDRGGMLDWSCDYPTFLERKQAALEIEEKEWKQFDKKLAQEEVWIRQGIRARRTRNEGRVRALKAMREERRKRRTRIGQVSMAISLGERSGDKVLEAKNAAFGYGGTPLLRNFSFTLSRGDRVGIIGPNGCGKTTLLNLMLGKLQPQAGHIELGAQVAPLYFDQLREGIDLEKTVWENVAPEGSDTVLINGAPRHVIGYLQDFLFTSDRARTPVKILSGGERHRLLLARLFTQPSNLLVFDEPTNDLDTETLELLEETLLNYPGTLLVVSHDREFLNNVATSALIFQEGEVREYVGGYDDWERQLAAAAPKVPPAASGEKRGAPAPAAQRKLSFKEKRELETLPARIEALDAELETLQGQLADFVQCQQPGFVPRTKARLAEIETELKAAYGRWEELEAVSKSGS
jgi:ABC transport system ATP-binding/permease protein